MEPDRRQAARNRLFQRASVVFNGGRSMFGCSVRNLSETGALLRMTDWIALPPTFEIETQGDPGSRRARQCWRRGDDVGVAFQPPGEDAAAAPVCLAAFRARRDARRGRDATSRPVAD